MTLPTEILVEILERTAPAALYFSCRWVSKAFRKRSEYLLREKLRFTMLDNTTYSGKTHRPCGFHTARRLATSSQVPQFGAQRINPGYYATEKHRKWLERNVRLPWKCTIAALQFSTLCRDEDLWGRRLIFHSELKFCPIGGFSHMAQFAWAGLVGSMDRRTACPPAGETRSGDSKASR